MAPITTPAAARAWLDSLIDLQKLAGVAAGSGRRVAAPTLSGMRALLELLGSPQLQYPAIHLTGTNGKTTATRITTDLLVAAGLSVGTDTSPYLERFNERMSWNGEPITDDEFDEVLLRVAALADLLPKAPTYFEAVHGCALEWFADVAVDVAVVEVGLGGAWDSTNVVDGQVAVVTNVELDHMEYLGPTRADIAAEKAGIVKPGATLVLGETDPELVPLFTDRGAAEVLLRDRDFGLRRNDVAHGGRLVTMYTPAGEHREVFLALHGAHQADNAVAALTAAEAFVGTALDDELVADVFAATRSPGRLEVVGHHPLVLLDGAHNVAGAHALRTALRDEFAPAPRVWVIGLLRQKDATEMLEALGVGETDVVVCCRAPSPRAQDPALVADAALAVGAGAAEIIDDVAAALARAVEVAGEEGQVVVAGTLYVVGAARTVTRG